MVFYKDLEKRKEIVMEYIKNNPTATFREIKEKIHIKINKVYVGGMDEAYEYAGVIKPRTLKFKTKDEKREIIIDFIRRNPTAGGHIIKKGTKINFLTVFKNTKEMFKKAGVPYPRLENLLLKTRSLDERKKVIFSIIKKNPLIGVEELSRLSKVSIYNNFDSIKELYRGAGINYLGKGAKLRMRKRLKVIEYLRRNNFATQREINKSCKTHVQLVFNRGIFEAYEDAGIPFPFERLRLHGTAIKKIKDDSRIFEEEIAKKLSGYGTVNRLVKTKRGFADIILERKGRKVAIELKNYKIHEISISQIKQLNKYVEDIGSNLGFLVCLRKPKRDMFLMGENKIFVLLESELSKIPTIMDP